MTRHWPCLCLAVAIVAHGATRAYSGELMVGAYYYPWYGSFDGGHDLRQSVRGHLVPPQRPAIGLYSSRAATTR